MIRNAKMVLKIRNEEKELEENKKKQLVSYLGKRL